jgi:hypothetical protein
LVNGREEQIYVFKKPLNQNFIVYQVLGNENKKNFTVVILPIDYEIEIGRSGTEMIFNENTVTSKQHAFIKYDSEIQDITLYDNLSKFGTFKLI